MGLRIGSVVINCDDFETTIAFWQQALGYQARRAAEGDFAILHDPTGRSPNLSVQDTDELKFGRNRTHLDLYATDQKAEVDRLVRLGATVKRLPEPGEDYVILADPEGKVFCVIQAAPAESKDEP
jgi:predicted enzyme related to lactoylglutathione lyase